MKYKKGESGNPLGRPKGAISKTRERLEEIKRLAAQDYYKAYTVLFEQVLMGKAWAHHLYFTLLTPKRYKQPTIMVEINDSSIEGQIASLTGGLAEFNEYTREELLNTLKLLSNIKISEIVAIQDAQARLSREEVTERLKLFDRAISHAEANATQKIIDNGFEVAKVQKAT